MVENLGKEMDLSEADLSGAVLVETNLERATLTSCKIFGISAWELKTERRRAEGFGLTPPSESVITVDNLEVGPVHLFASPQRKDSR
jgi:hypothetical protein